MGWCVCALLGYILPEEKNKTKRAVFIVVTEVNLPNMGKDAGGRTGQAGAKT